MSTFISPKNRKRFAGILYRMADSTLKTGNIDLSDTDLMEFQQLLLKESGRLIKERHRLAEVHIRGLHRKLPIKGKL
jgi:hypothetical protein